jgi:alkaline phosphatase D
MKRGLGVCCAALGALLWMVTVSGDAAAEDSRPGSVTTPRAVVGYTTETEVAMLVQTDAPETVRVRYWPEGKPAESQTTRGRRTRKSRNHVAHFRIPGLTPGTRYRYAIDGSRGTVDHDWQVFRALPLMSYGAGPYDFVAALGSCAYTSDPEEDPSESYGAEQVIFERIADQKPDLMLWLGDNVYFRSRDDAAASRLGVRYTRSRSIREVQRLLGGTHNYATWDDHDFGPNDSDWTYPFKGEALHMFRRFWRNPGYGLPELPGVFTRFRVSDVEFFLVDGRYHRTPWRAPDGPGKRMLGEVQTRWLLDALTGSTAQFKVVVSGSQMMNNMVKWEGWAKYDSERQAFLTELQRRGVEGVMFLSGDRHHTELIRKQRSGFYPLYDFTSSPLTSGAHDASGEANNAQRVDGTLVTDKRNFGLLRFVGPKGERKVVLETRGVDGEVIWTREIRAAELTVPVEGGKGKK